MSKKIFYSNNIYMKGWIIMDHISDFFWNTLLRIWNFIPTLLLAIIVFAVGFFLNRMVLNIFSKGAEKSKLDQTVNKFLASVIKIVITALVLIIALSVLGIPMTSIITVLGTMGVAVGLALKDSLSNVAGGVILLINRTIKVGDYVDIGAYSGVVDEVSILFTKITTLDNKDIFIPNGTVATSAITNYSSEGDRRVDLVFAVSYNNDCKQAISAIKSVIDKHPLVIKDKEIFVRLGELGQSSMNITVRVWTKNADYWTVYFDLIEQVKEKFDEEKIVIPYNQVDVHIAEKAK